MKKGYCTRFADAELAARERYTTECKRITPLAKSQAIGNPETLPKQKLELLRCVCPPLTLLVKSRQSNFNFRGVHFIRGTTLRRFLTKILPRHNPLESVRLQAF